MSFPQRVSPQENFSCSLGVDSAVRITYHPLSTKARSAGGSFIIMSSQTNTSLFEQLITVKNTRLRPLSPLIVKDRVPVSRDSKIKVNLLKPSNLPSREKGSPTKSVQVGDGVQARWAKRNDDEGQGSERELEGDASFGRMEWVCDVTAGASIDLALAWEITVPAGVTYEVQ